MRCRTCGRTFDEPKGYYCNPECQKAYARNSYRAQQNRGILRKAVLVSMFGGCCSECGYDKALAGLCFHHLEGSGKSFPLDLRHLSNRSWKSCLEEAKKCILLCSTCHNVLHAQGCYDRIDFSPALVENLPQEYALALTPRKKSPGKKCSLCSASISAKASKCVACAHKALEHIEWPSTSVLVERVQATTYTKVAEQLGVSARSLRKRIKRHPDYKAPQREPQ